MEASSSRSASVGLRTEPKIPALKREQLKFSVDAVWLEEITGSDRTDDEVAAKSRDTVVGIQSILELSINILYSDGKLEDTENNANKIDNMTESQRV